MDAAQERLAQLSRTQQALLAKIQALEEQEQGAPLGEVMLTLARRSPLAVAP